MTLAKRAQRMASVVGARSATSRDAWPIKVARESSQPLDVVRAVEAAIEGEDTRRLARAHLRRSAHVMASRAVDEADPDTLVDVLERTDVLPPKRSGAPQDQNVLVLGCRNAPLDLLPIDHPAHPALNANAITDGSDKV